MVYKSKYSISIPNNKEAKSLPSFWSGVIFVWPKTEIRYNTYLSITTPSVKLYLQSTTVRNLVKAEPKSQAYNKSRSKEVKKDEYQNQTEPNGGTTDQNRNHQGSNSHQTKKWTKT
jgi:hypothetical protein